MNKKQKNLVPVGVKLHRQAPSRGKQFSTGWCHGPVLNAGTFSTNGAVLGGKPVLTGGSHPVQMPVFLAV